jgi:hypothetical protein
MEALATQHFIFVQKWDVFWDAIPCNLVGAYHRFHGTCCLYLQVIRYSLKMEAIELHETFVAIHQNICHIQEDCNRIFIGRMNLKSHMKYCSCTKRDFLDNFQFSRLCSILLHVISVLTCNLNAPSSHLGPWQAILSSQSIIVMLFCRRMFGYKIEVKIHSFSSSGNTHWSVSLQVNISRCSFGVQKMYVY